MSARRFVLVAWGLAAACAAAVGAAHAAGLRLNTTPSVPLGLWRVTAAGPVQRGDVVSYCPPDAAAIRAALERGYLGAGRCPGGTQPLLKPVAALPGDTVRVEAAGLRVNGRALAGSQAVPADGAGCALPRLETGDRVVAPGTLWLVSERPDSFDSRYLGPLPAAGVVGRALPLWVWR